MPFFHMLCVSNPALTYPKHLMKQSTFLLLHCQHASSSYSHLDWYYNRSNLVKCRFNHIIPYLKYFLLGQKLHPTILPITFPVWSCPNFILVLSYKGTLSFPCLQNPPYSSSSRNYHSFSTLSHLCQVNFYFYLKSYPMFFLDYPNEVSNHQFPAFWISFL